MLPIKEEKTGTVLEFCHVTLLWNKRYSNSLIVDGWVIKKFVVNDRKTLDDYLGKAPVQESQMSSTEMIQATGDESTLEPLDQDETSNWIWLCLKRTLQKLCSSILITLEGIDGVTESVTQLIGIILTEPTVAKDLTTESNDMNMTEMETADVSDSSESDETEKETESIDNASLGSADEEQEGNEVIPDGEYENQDTSEPKETDGMVPNDAGIVPDLVEPTTSSTLEYTTHEIDEDEIDVENVNVSQDNELDHENTTEFDELEETSENPSPQADSDETEEVSSDEMKVTTNLPHEDLTKKELQPQIEQDETTTQIPDELKNPQGKTPQSDHSDPESSTIQLQNSVVNQTTSTVKPMVQEMEVTTMIPLPEFPITTAPVDEDTSSPTDRVNWQWNLWVWDRLTRIANITFWTHFEIPITLARRNFQPRAINILHRIS